MKQQNYKNHRQFTPMYHYLTIPLAIMLFLATGIVAVSSIVSGREDWFPAIILFILSLTLSIGITVARMSTLKVQDRAIRAEENLRHYVLTGRLLDPGLTINQIIALRFAGDKEFPALCEKAATEQLHPDAIKKAIQDWRADFHRA